MFPENLYWVEKKSSTALKGTLQLHYQLKCKQECHCATEGADNQSGEARAFEYTPEVKWDNVVCLSSFHPVTLNYKHLLAESHRCLRELKIFIRQGRHLNTLWKS